MAIAEGRSYIPRVHLFHMGGRSQTCTHVDLGKRARNCKFSKNAMTHIFNEGFRYSNAHGHGLVAIFCWATSRNSRTIPNLYLTSGQLKGFQPICIKPYQMDMLFSGFDWTKAKGDRNMWCCVSLLLSYKSNYVTKITHKNLLSKPSLQTWRYPLSKRKNIYRAVILGFQCAPQFCAKDSQPKLMATAGMSHCP